MSTFEWSTLQSEIIYHWIFDRILAQHFITITFQLPLVMLPQKWVEMILEMRRNHMLLQTFIILERILLWFHFTQIHSKLVNCYSCSSGLTVRELVVHVINPTFCANQIWWLYYMKFKFQPPAQAQVAGQAPPGGPGGAAQAPAGPPAGGGPPAGWQSPCWRSKYKWPRHCSTRK